MAVTAGVFFFVQLAIHLEFYYSLLFFLLANDIVFFRTFLCHTLPSGSQDNEDKKSLILGYLV